jgi:hypothetical protein
VDETKDLSRSNRHRCQRNVRPRIGSEPDNNHRSTRADHLREAHQRWARVHLVKCRHRHDGVE